NGRPSEKTELAARLHDTIEQLQPVRIEHYALTRRVSQFQDLLVRHRELRPLRLTASVRVAGLHEVEPVRAELRGELPVGFRERALREIERTEHIWNLGRVEREIMCGVWAWLYMRPEVRIDRIFRVRQPLARPDVHRREPTIARECIRRCPRLLVVSCRIEHG